MGAPLLPWLLLLLLLLSHSARTAILEVNGNLSCRCAKTTSEYISPKKYESIEIRPVGSSCRRTEIIFEAMYDSHRTAWIRSDLKAHPVPPPARGRDAFHYPRLFQALSSVVLDASRDPGAATAFLGNLCQGLTSLPGNDFPHYPI
ncbi:hypothetical protein DUI87_08675 [Hirundo rustica rustica]|uniref:Chemokine interleukin-8-like domain-containing protein n=1 Tax=Hirundo rustica rustica TaxID=333673 RepID=A0A3M0KK27_HIRRU|nr:hypothetical protein DUI87_08675 [Hirundo rustica rustica]